MRKIFKISLLALIAVFVLNSCSKEDNIKVIAHRGYWDTEKSSENSISSLNNAAKIKCHGSEFDVRFTKDMIAVVCHDAEIQGHKISETNYKDIQLANGENLLKLDVFLESLKNKKLHLMVDVKPDDTRADRIVKKTKHILNYYKLLDRAYFTSSSLAVAKQLVVQIPESQVFYPSNDLSPEQLKKIGFAGIDCDESVLRANPELVSACHALEMKVGVFTVDKEKDMRYFAAQGVDFITTNKPLLAKKLVKSL